MFCLWGKSVGVRHVRRKMESPVKRMTAKNKNVTGSNKESKGRKCNWEKSTEQSLDRGKRDSQWNGYKLCNSLVSVAVRTCLLVIPAQHICKSCTSLQFAAVTQHRVSGGSKQGGMSTESPTPPPPLPPTAPPPPVVLPGSSKKKLYQAIAEGKSPVVGDHKEAQLLLRQREGSFRQDLQWALFNKYVPSLIQDGPQCGLVALWMAAHLLQHPLAMTMESVVHTAMQRGYTAQGEVFSARDMALLAEEVCGCHAEHLSGGMGGDNSSRIVRHLSAGLPVLIPYDEDFNHEPCLRSGHRAHWAVASGILLGVAQGTLKGHFQADPALPWLLLPRDAPCWQGAAVEEVYILAKQGKSLRYQLWPLEALERSNSQLREMDPKRAADGTAYVLPQGGLQVGLAGQAVLLHRQTDRDVNPAQSTEQD
ncbi:actin maturation protease isoform X2 [Conger conger]|uniref:actin maturation protease isoform X2 n=1 Tax=Conger conger TaxID=82655 RepID=UPI002A5AE9E0|nr:actin maturation protease isoform X2 [Conger conger]